MFHQKSERQSHHGKGKTAGLEPWDEKKALDKVTEALREQEAKVVELQEHIDHTQEFVVARLEAENNIGAVLSMKQVLKYEALKEHTEKAVTALKEVLHAIETHHHVDYEAKIHAIISVPVPAVVLTDKNDVLDEARLRMGLIKDVELHQKGSRAA